MSQMHMLHTAFLQDVERRAIRDLLDEAFDGDVTEEDVEHALGGIHVLVWEQHRLVGHGSVVMRRLLHGGRALRTGYVEGVAVTPDRRRQGIGAQVMGSLEQVIRGGYELGALSASDEAVPFYEARVWRRWTGTASVMGPHGITPTPGEEESLFVLPVTAELSWDGDLACDWREGDVW